MFILIPVITIYKLLSKAELNILTCNRRHAKRMKLHTKSKNYYRLSIVIIVLSVMKVPEREE